MGILKSFTSCTIVIGKNLKTNKSYHLLVDRNDVKLDVVMTPQEHHIVDRVIKGLGLHHDIQNLTDVFPEEKHLKLQRNGVALDVKLTDQEYHLVSNVIKAIQ